MNSYYDQKEYIGRSVHYWKVVLPQLEKIRNRRSIPEPLDPLFIHFPSKDIQVDIVLKLPFLNDIFDTSSEVSSRVLTCTYSIHVHLFLFRFLL